MRPFDLDRVQIMPVRPTCRRCPAWCAQSDVVDAIDFAQIDYQDSMGIGLADAGVCEFVVSIYLVMIGAGGLKSIKFVASVKSVDFMASLEA